MTIISFSLGIIQGLLIALFLLVLDARGKGLAKIEQRLPQPKAKILEASVVPGQTESEIVIAERLAEDEAKGKASYLNDLLDDI